MTGISARLAAASAGNRRGPRPGDRLPDARVQRGGAETWLHEALTAPTFHLLLCGPPALWDDAAVADLRESYAPFLTVHRVCPGGGPSGVDLWDVTGAVLQRLGVHGSASLVVRPDGHIGHRADHVHLAGADDYLRRWLSPRGGRTR